MINIEYCIECDGATGNAGRDEDSLYAGEFGTYCEECWCEVPVKLAEAIKAKDKEITDLKYVLNMFYSENEK